jgi:hypothetical protein
VIVDKEGNYYGRLTLNRFHPTDWRRLKTDPVADCDLRERLHEISSQFGLDFQYAPCSCGGFGKMAERQFRYEQVRIEQEKTESFGCFRKLPQSPRSRCTQRRSRTIPAP